MTETRTLYKSDMRPEFEPFSIQPPAIKGFGYSGDLAYEIRSHHLDGKAAVDLLDDMLAIREVEEMIVRLRSGGYEPLQGFAYRGPTHVSIGQEGTAVGASSVLGITDRISSSHRGHGDAVAKGFSAIRQMDDEQLKERVPWSEAKDHDGLLADALEEHIYRIIAELFGKDEGYCAGRGGGMHIGDFSTGHLGANAIVGGSVPIATGAAMAKRYLASDDVVVCFAGDGAYANGVVLESLNWAAQYQWKNFLAGDKAYGLPIVYVIQNNHYGMTHRTDDEVMGIKALAVRGAGFAEDGMHAEIVNGMDVLAVRDAVTRATELCRSGEGPVLIEASTYRYYGHSLSDPRNEYRTKEEEEAWKAVDPIENLGRQLVENKILTEEGLGEVKARAAARNAKAAIRASKATDPAPEDVLKYMYAGTVSEEVPPEFAKPTLYDDAPKPKITDAGMLQKDALREAMIEEMERDERVIFYGEDVADYGGAFKASKGLMERFGRDRVFNTPISEAAIIGTGVGAAMAGLRPVVELMYMDFALMASDQIANQAGKWHFMSGGQTTIPMVIRCSVGAGKGYGGQHSQSLESLFTHLPGLVVAYPSSAEDAKGMLKSAIRSDDPVLFCESQGLYAARGPVPEGEYTVPLGKSAVVREGGDATVVAWGPAVPDALKAAEALAGEGIECDVIDLRTLVPLDMEPVLASVAKTGRCVVAAQAILSGSYVNEVVARVVNEAFDDLDAPVARIGAANGISPQAEGLEAAFLPGADDIAAAVKGLI
ncbi:MAG: dehydrogenase E1 component subunit alpha/beta [Candidatus Limnocylindrales bacterium]